MREPFKRKKKEIIGSKTKPQSMYPVPNVAEVWSFGVRLAFRTTNPKVAPRI